MKTCLIILALTSFARASFLRSHISDLDLSKESGRPHLLKLENGRVAFLPYDSGYLASVETHYEYKSDVGLELNEKNEVVGMTVFYPEEKPRGGTRCTDWKSYRPKACAGFTFP